MARSQTLVQLNDTLLAMLDQRAAKQRISRSQIIRDAIEAYLASDYEADVTRQMLAGYERIPQATADKWGDPIRFTAAAARELHQRLDAEERTAGHEPW
jgi:predicted DNA-binding protein